MVGPKLYSETAPTEGLKEGVAVGEEVGPEDGATEVLCIPHSAEVTGNTIFNLLRCT